jgi:predicted lipid carrier protein YhbT
VLREPEHLFELRDVALGADLERSLADGPRGRLDAVQLGLEKRLEALAPREAAIIDISAETPESEAQREVAASV